MLNSCCFAGRLVDEPKFFEGETNRVCFTLAVERDVLQRDGKPVSDYLDFVAWKETASFIATHFKKGDLMQVSNARAKVRLYEDSDGIKKRKTEFEIDKVYCLARSRGREDVEE